ncbi:hypothetical protein BC826DRAFT_186472 [Russula brevipes]|nr:hypothetical protein BC826DRAFT_186472 [Russula brevipes]
MSTQNRGSQPQSSTQTSFIARIKDRVYYYLYRPKPAFLVPLSWILTLQVFAISVIWHISTLPIRISIDLYERHIRAIFPQLPSIRRLLLSARTAVLTLFPDPAPDDPSLTTPSRLPQGSQDTAAPAAPLPTLDVDLNALLAGS